MSPIIRSEPSWNGKPLIGFYPFDLEGVAPKAVSVIEKGILKSFLTTRQPIKGFPASNGHARLAGSYGASSAAIANLFMKASETTPLADLKKQSDRDVQAARQTLRHAGTQTRLSVFGRRAANCKPWRRPARSPADRRGR